MQANLISNRYRWADSGCSEKEALQALGNIQAEGKIDAIIGPRCSAACLVTSHLAAGQGIPQISPSCTSPDLSSHSLFARTTAPESAKGLAVIAFMRQHQWQHQWHQIVMLASTENVWFQSGLDLIRQLEDAGYLLIILMICIFFSSALDFSTVVFRMKVLAPSPFEPGNFQEGTLALIARAGMRIVFIFAYDQDATTICTKAKDRRMITGWSWWEGSDVHLSPVAAMHGWLFLEPLVSTEQMGDFAELVSQYSKRYFDLAVSPDSVDITYSATLYDSIALYAHAATRLLADGGNLKDGAAVAQAVRQTSFVGIGGSVVTLDENGDRVWTYEIMNYVLKDDAVRPTAVGVFYSGSEHYEAYKNVIWPGNTTTIPADWVAYEFGGGVLSGWIVRSMPAPWLLSR